MKYVLVAIMLLFVSCNPMNKVVEITKVVEINYILGVTPQDNTTSDTIIERITSDVPDPYWPEYILWYVETNYRVISCKTNIRYR